MPAFCTRDTGVAAAISSVYAATQHWGKVKLVGSNQKRPRARVFRIGAVVERHVDPHGAVVDLERDDRYRLRVDRRAVVNQVDEHERARAVRQHRGPRRGALGAQGKARAAGARRRTFSECLIPGRRALCVLVAKDARGKRKGRLAKDVARVRVRARASQLLRIPRVLTAAGVVRERQFGQHRAPRVSQLHRRERVARIQHAIKVLHVRHGVFKLWRRRRDAQHGVALRCIAVVDVDEEPRQRADEAEVVVEQVESGAPDRRARRHDPARRELLVHVDGIGGVLVVLLGRGAVVVGVEHGLERRRAVDHRAVVVDDRVVERDRLELAGRLRGARRGRRGAFRGIELAQRRGAVRRGDVGLQQRDHDGARVEVLHGHLHQPLRLADGGAGQARKVQQNLECPRNGRREHDRHVEGSTLGAKDT